ncbi:hypothetical protein AGMMS49965_16410 [Bacteroidia bacterium]|nr:hypothetical protein AGMMS49965_16410 [Bacteroidia bacterium]
MKQKLQKVSHGMLNQAKRFGRFIFAAVLASSTLLPAFAADVISSVTVINPAFAPAVYNGTLQVPTVADLYIRDDAGTVITSGVIINVTGSTASSGNHGTDVGIVTIEVVDDGLTSHPTYTVGTNTTTYEIVKATPTLADLDPATIVFPAGVLAGIEYDGDDHTTDWATFSPAIVATKSGEGTLTVEYDGGALPVNAGTYTVTVVFDGSGDNFFAGTVTLPTPYVIEKATPTLFDLDVTGATIPTGNITFDGTPQSVTGSAVAFESSTPKSNPGGSFAIMYNGSTPPTNVGSYTVTAEIGEGDNYIAGSVVLSNFDIVPLSLNSGTTLVLSASSEVYTGSQLMLAIASVDNSGVTPTALAPTDYTISYGPNINEGAGAGSVTVNGIGNFTGSETTTFDINAKSLAATTVGTDPDIEITFPTAPITYNGNFQTPPILVRDVVRDAPLLAGVDYIVLTPGEYNNNQDAGTADVTITGMGNYDGGSTKQEFFEINKKVLTISGATVTAVKTFNNATAITNADVAVTFSGFVAGQTFTGPGTAGSTYDYEIVADYSSANAGTGIPVIGTVTLDNANPLVDAKNYTFATGATTDLPSTLTGDIAKAGGLTVTPQNLNINAFGTGASDSYPFDLNNLLLSAADAGTRSYSNVDSVHGSGVTFGPIGLSGANNRMLNYAITGGSAAGGAAITVDVETQNYTTASVSLPIVVTSDVIETLSFAVEDTAFIYGHAPITDIVATPGAYNRGSIDYSSSDPTVADVIYTGEVIIGNAGTATITAKIAPGAGHSGAETSYNITVEPKDLYVTALPQTIIASTGAIAVAGPTTVDYNGFENGEGAADLNTQPVLTIGGLDITAPRVVDNAITFSTAAADPNYNVHSSPGTLTIADVPTITGATAAGRNSEVVVTITNEVDNYAAITDYRVTLTPVAPDTDPATTVTRPVPGPIHVPAVNGKEYTVDVEAYNGVGLVGWSTPYTILGTVSPTAGDTRAATAPSNIVAVADTAKATVTFTTADPGNPAKTITGYTVRSTPHGIEKTGTGTSITVEGLTPDTTYTFKVTVNFADESGMTSVPSNAVTILAPADPDPVPNPTKPTNVTASAGTAGDGKATVTFIAHNDDKPVSKYTVVSTPGNISQEGAESPITVEGLTPGETYTFTVTVTFEDGTFLTSEASESVTLLESEGEGGGTGIIDVEEVAAMKLYPNPATESVTITGLQGNETLRFYDANGRAVFTRKAANSTEVIPVSQLQKGIYIVRIGTKALKLVKI